MNSASKNFPHHLAELRERLVHPTDYDTAVSYFLQEFAGDIEFIRASDQEERPDLVSILDGVVSKAVGHEVKIEGALISYLRAHRFIHGNARAGGRIVLFFYFEEIDTGIAMLITEGCGDAEVARFRLTGGLVNPQLN